METPEVRWVRKTYQYANGHAAKVGKWTVGSVDYSAAVTQGDPKKYVASIALPGLKRNWGHYETEEQARAQVEKAIAHWFGNV